MRHVNVKINGTRMHRRKNVRLRQSSYLGRRFYFVTLCCHQRREIFTHPDRCRWLLDCLRDVAVSRSFNIHAYCIMPDHIHLLAQGLKPSSDFLNFVKAFKIKTSREFANQTNEQLWQKNFYDHIVRPNESAESVAWYIWLNPVRAGLAAHPKDYPLTGSFTSRYRPASEGGPYKPNEN